MPFDSYRLRNIYYSARFIIEELSLFVLLTFSGLL